MVNEKWRRFADNNGGDHADYWVGENYFEVCERAADNSEATEVLDGIESMRDDNTDRVQIEYPCHGPDEHRWYMLEVVEFNFDGDQYFILTHSDITEHKLSEFRAGSRSEQLEVLMHILTHDVRNSLNLIAGYSENLSDLNDNSDAIEIIRESVQRVTKITDATLEFVKSGTVSNVKPISIEDVSREAWLRIPSPNASLKVQNDTKVIGDRELLIQLFEQLFTNAVEHGQGHNTVLVGSLPDGFYIEDDGPGISEEIRDQALAADFSTQGIDGVGLAIVQAIVSAHRGTLKIHEPSDGGARFEIRNLEVAPR